MSTWHRVAERGEIPSGQMRCFAVAGRRILVANIDGEYLATDDTCTHEDASLAGGVLREALVRCPLHGSRFDLRTGMPMEEPADEPLTCYRVRIDGDDVLVEIAP